MYQKMSLTHGHILLFLILALACQKQSTHRPYQEEVTDSKESTYRNREVSSDLTCITLIKQDYTIVVNPSLAAFSVELFFDPNTYQRTIQIYKAGDSVPYQMIDAGIGERLHYDEDLRAIDVNFDGYKDLVHLAWYGVTGNTGYSFYTYDSLSTTFILNTDFDGLGSPQFDDSRKLIYSHSGGGMAGNIYSSETYKYENGKLKLIHAVYQNFDHKTEHFIRKTKHLRNGQLKDSTTVIFPPFRR